MFRLINLPMPPSVHDQYRPVAMRIKSGPMAGRWTGRINPTAALNKFEKDCEAYEKANDLVIRKARTIVRGWISSGKQLELHLFAYFPGIRIYTTDMEPRQMDCSNRVKALEDQLARMILVDDKHYFRVIVEKVETRRDEPFCIAVFKPWVARDFAQVKQAEGL